MTRKQVPNVTHPDGTRTREYTTTRGVTVTLSPAPPLMQAAYRAALEIEWEAAGHPVPPKPTYDVTTAAGTVETHEHDEITIKEKPEYEAAWKAWKDATHAFELELREQVMRAIIIDCMDFEIDPAWDRRNKAKRITPPADEFERKVFYAQTMVLGGAEDYLAVMQQTAQLAGVTEQQIKAVRDSFSSDAQGAERDATGSAG